MSEFLIQCRKSAKHEWQDTTHVLDPTEHPQAKPDTTIGALRAFGCRDIDGKTGVATGSRTGRQYRAVAMVTDGPDATMVPTTIGNDAPYGRKSDGTPRKRPGRKANYQPAAESITADAPYGYKADGTPRLKPYPHWLVKGNKNPAPATANKAVTEDAPYGYKLDGTPAKKRGRKPISATVNESPAPKNGTPKRKAAKREIAAMIDGSIPMDAERMTFLASIVAR